MKKLISVIVALAMILSLSVAAFAVGTVTVYCKAPDNWDTCHVHWWNSSQGASTWPGQAMTKGSDGIWYAEIPADVGGLLFNKQGEDGKTNDMTLPIDNKLMYVIGNNEWVEYGTEDAISSGTVTLNSTVDEESKVVEFKPDTDGKLKVHMFASNPGWAFKVNFPDGSSTLRISGNNDRTETMTLLQAKPILLKSGAMIRPAGITAMVMLLMQSPLRLPQAAVKLPRKSTLFPAPSCLWATMT